MIHCNAVMTVAIEFDRNKIDIRIRSELYIHLLYCHIKQRQGQDGCEDGGGDQGLGDYGQPRFRHLS